MAEKKKYHLKCFNCGKDERTNKVPSWVRKNARACKSSITSCSKVCYNITRQKFFACQPAIANEEEIASARLFVEMWDNDKTRNPFTGRKIADRHVGVRNQMESCHKKYKKVIYYTEHPDEKMDAINFMRSLGNFMVEAHNKEILDEYDEDDVDEDDD
jgi:hypothetical protein